MKNFQNKAKIIKVSEALRIILFLGFVVWAFAFVSCLLPWFIALSMRQHVFPIQAYAWSGVILQPLLGFLVNLKLYQFVNRLKCGCLFDFQTVGYLSAAGKLWLGYWIYQTLFFGGRALFFQVSMYWDFGCLFGALTLIFGAWFFREAQALQEEQALTV
jgi:hypothetical protein